MAIEKNDLKVLSKENKNAAEIIIEEIDRCIKDRHGGTDKIDHISENISLGKIQKEIPFSARCNDLSSWTENPPNESIKQYIINKYKARGWVVRYFGFISYSLSGVLECDIELATPEKDKKIKKQNKDTIIGMILGTLLAFVIYYYPFFGVTFQDTPTKLRDKHSDMSNLKDCLERKLSKTEDLRIDLTGEIERLKIKIRDSNLSYNEAIQDPIVSQELALLQRKMAYKKQLIAVKQIMIKGKRELEIKIDEVHTDLQMIEVLGEDQAQELFAGIDTVLNNYKPYAEDKIIDQSRLKLQPLSEIWQNLPK